MLWPEGFVIFTFGQYIWLQCYEKNSVNRILFSPNIAPGRVRYHSIASDPLWNVIFYTSALHGLIPGKQVGQNVHPTMIAMTTIMLMVMMMMMSH